ncbi:MAG: hypothetical protein TREMPRED_000359 [Tremellales sp. Tagirdzhanova-0007]|nr:MAG: hypothetical protein TREMPRED_000359 [Tremellales sp. Tagirdzhanova-0007]
MSPILKRDISEHVRHARRLVAAATGQIFDDRIESAAEDGRSKPSETYASGSSPRQGIGVYEDDRQKWYAGGRWEREDRKGKGKATDCDGGVEASDEEVGERGRMLFDPGEKGGDGGLREELEYGEVELGIGSSSLTKEKWNDLRNLLLEATPSLLLSLVGLVFTGELLEHLARWRVFQRVDELFILVPMIGNLKGNLEMCLSARLGTSANIGELDHRLTRRALLTANMTLLGLQALLISSLAAFISFVLGLLTIHRLGDVGSVPVAEANSTTVAGGMGLLADDPGLGVGEEWHEGYTRPGWKQLVMVLATGMGAAGLSSAVLGSFMSSMIVLCRWAGLNPDNMTPPIASCLGDLLTLFLLSLLGSLLVGTMDSPVPMIAVIIMSVAAAWFTHRVMQNHSYALPILSALVDFVGQLLLMLAYEICIWEGRDVLVEDG